MFTLEDRDQVRDHVLRMAAGDPRVVAGAVVGSLAHSDGDRFSDLDLTFAVTNDCPIGDVLEDWTTRVEGDLGGARLFDVTSGPSIYRVFLLPGCLQVDLSFTPASQFGAAGRHFRLLFGELGERPPTSPQATAEIFGEGVHHALRARVSLERGRSWQAAHWIDRTRDRALDLACHRRGLPAAHGRGHDDLPVEVLTLFRHSFPTSLERAELLRALKQVIEGLMSETADVPDLAERVAPQLKELAR